VTHTIDDVGGYLLERGLLGPADVVDGPLMVRDVSRRNRCLRVTSRAGRGYLIKRADLGQPGTATSVRTEADFYRLCWSEPALAGLRGLLPRPVVTGGREPTLVLELLEGALPLLRHCARPEPPAFDPRAAPALGAALGRLHSAFRAAVAAADPRLPGRERGRPWILAVHRPEPALLDRLSPANLQLLKIVQRQPGLAERLEAAGAEWRVATVVHGDIKSDNVLVGPGWDAAGEPRIRLVDWEFAQPGDAAWDLGSAFADFVAFWLESVPLGSRHSVRQDVAEARYPLAVIRPALGGLWQRYRMAASVDGDEAEGLLDRAVRYSAARLVQTAYERSTLARALPHVAVGCLQLAVNMLADPARARRDLLGLPADGGGRR
jgi:aminoglycoside phosphotransferase (APT) family kinase protein